MDLREQRGMELAATRTIQQKAGIWIVPSQAGTGTYRVHLCPRLPLALAPTTKHAERIASTFLRPVS
jgi:hypothetical protein